MIINIVAAKDHLRHGEIIAVPTDTVYGIAADMYNQQSILKLYSVKNRKSKKPLVVQLAKSSDVTKYLSFIPFDLEKITQRFWPGALTLVLPVKEEMVPGFIRAHLPTAAFRVANNDILRSLIADYGPLAISSANPSGEKELASVDEIEKTFGKNFPVMQGDSEVGTGVASTVLAYVDASWVILRKGSLLLKDLCKVIGYNPPVVSSVDFVNKSYTISPQLHCLEQPYDGSIKVVIGFEGRKYPQAEKVICLGDISKPADVKKAIIKTMHLIQDERHPHVWVDMNFPKTGLMKEVARILERSSEISL
ncbi:MAG: Threonylcarbamoyl-AMP synthase [Chlamydiae bacterium]|nr:Threonylcarbamoyl-AMP synthase [Chlamydiota bacterium]